MNDFREYLCCSDGCLSPYSKLLLASPAQALSLVTEEKAVLQAQLSQDVDSHGCFIQSALCLLQVISINTNRPEHHITFIYTGRVCACVCQEADGRLNVTSLQQCR